MLEVPFFEEKLEQLKTATNAEGRHLLRGLMREPEKWTTSISHHLVNTTLTKCRLKRKIGTHPIPVYTCHLHRTWLPGKDRRKSTWALEHH